MLLRLSRNAGTEALSRKVAEVLERSAADFRLLHPDDFGHWEKVETLARDIYGAAGVIAPGRRTDPERQFQTS